MGYNTSIFVSQVDRSLLCGICAGVFRKPLVTHCGHTFCEECLERWMSATSHVDKTCPVCRRDVDLSKTAPVLALRAFIEGLSVECENSINGCTMVLNLGELESHLKSCRYTLLECNSCDKMFLQSEIHEHRSLCVKLSDKSFIDGRVHAEIAAIQKELSQTKKSLQSSEETVRRLKKSLRDLRVRKQTRLSQPNAEDFDPAWDPDYAYGYSPRSIAHLASFISRFLINKPSYVDLERIFACLKRCFDFYHNCAAYWQDVHMLLATAAACHWFTESQRATLNTWLKSIARERLLSWYWHSCKKEEKKKQQTVTVSTVK